MPDERRYESADLEDYEAQDASDTLDGDPGDDPLDRGVIPPGRWSTAIRSEAVTGDPESLDEQLAAEEPDAELDDEDDLPSEADGADEDAADEEIDGLLLDDGPDPRAGRLVGLDEGAHPVSEADLVARDAGIDGAAATAEEAAVHVVDDDDNDIRSEG
jgi:Family of unknown function (DUF5709)